ncbi:MAG: DNA mismatch endonuclease Vsr [Oscillospiraceae bacterium]|nr:DNA mismatch endonuclease Vsr [Oscillospiraceae bacterium]
MADIFQKDKRSQVMRQVKSQGNKTTEMKLISYFKSKKITGWRRNYKVKGHPDFVFLKTKIAVFVDGCFWHGHDCRNIHPVTNADFWDKKRQYNIEHDKRITSEFQSRGWQVIRIWECELKKKNRSVLEAKLASLENGKQK